MWNSPKQHTKKRGGLGNTQKKDKKEKKKEKKKKKKKEKKREKKRRAGMWAEEVYQKDQKGRIQNEKSPMKCWTEQNH